MASGPTAVFRSVKSNLVSLQIKWKRNTHKSWNSEVKHSGITSSNQLKVSW